FDVKVVVANFQNQEGNVDLVYNVARGSRYKVETVGFRGNQGVDRDELIQQVAVKRHGWLFSRGKFSDKLLRESVNGITAFYKNRGYEKVAVDTDVAQHELKIYITFLVVEGPQTLVDDFRIEGNSHIAELDLTPRGGLRLRPGQPF